MNVEHNLTNLIMQHCSYLEVDTKIILHVLKFFQSRVKDVYIPTNKNEKIVAECGVDLKSYYLTINTSLAMLGQKDVRSHFSSFSVEMWLNFKLLSSQ